MAEPIDTEREAREALAEAEPITVINSREYGEMCVGRNHTVSTGVAFVCEVANQRTTVPIDNGANALPPVPDVEGGGWNERYFAHVGRALIVQFPALDAEAEAARIVSTQRNKVETRHLRNALALLDAERLARQTVERERDLVRGALAAVGNSVGAMLSADCSPAFLALVQDEVRLVFQRLTRERDEARAMAPRWVPSSLNMWHLQVGTATFGRIWPTVRYWSAKTAGCASERVDTQEDAARAVCARLGLPYIEVPRG